MQEILHHKINSFLKLFFFFYAIKLVFVPLLPFNGEMLFLLALYTCSTLNGQNVQYCNTFQYNSVWFHFKEYTQSTDKLHYVGVLIVITSWFVYKIGESKRIMEKRCRRTCKVFGSFVRVRLFVKLSVRYI